MVLVAEPGFLSGFGYAKRLDCIRINPRKSAFSDGADFVLGIHRGSNFPNDEEIEWGLKRLCDLKTNRNPSARKRDDDRVLKELFFELFRQPQSGFERSWLHVGTDPASVFAIGPGWSPLCYVYFAITIRINPLRFGYATHSFTR